MKVLVMNGSPKGERSDTIRLTKAFLEGMEVKDYEIIHTIYQQVKPCLGCYSCWWKTPGKCIQSDGMEEVLHRMKQSDLIIWSYPLYIYGMPSNLKAYVDRLLLLSSPVQEIDANGETYHPARGEHKMQHMMISGCGFPNKVGNFDGAIFAFQKMFGNVEIITCVEAPLLNIQGLEPITAPYLELVKQAGREYARNGVISESTHQLLDIPMYDPEEYRKMVGGQ